MGVIPGRRGHHEFGPLPAAAVNAVWCLTNHPGTLTPEWYAQTVDGLPSAEYYVELVGIVGSSVLGLVMWWHGLTCH